MHAAFRQQGCNALGSMCSLPAWHFWSNKGFAGHMMAHASTSGHSIMIKYCLLTGSGGEWPSPQAICKASIPQPLALQPASGQLLHCTLALGQGSAMIQSGPASGPWATHLQASYLPLHTLSLPTQARPHRGLLRLASGILKLAPGVAGLARLALSVCGSHTGFTAHPALVDSSLHLGAALAAALAPQPAAAAAARVPVAIGLFLAAAPVAGANKAQDAAACAALETAASKALSHYGITSDGGAGAVQLCDLEVRLPSCHASVLLTYAFLARGRQILPPGLHMGHERRVHLFMKLW